MRVIAIDPGYGRCGMAVVEKTNGKEVLIHSTCVETSAKSEFTERLSLIANTCLHLMEEFKPDSFAIEKLYFNSNQKTAMRVAEVRGTLINAATQFGLPVFEYTPGEIKSAVASSGRADKKQVATMLHAFMRIDKKIEYDDEYDAIAIAVTHLARVRQ
jgi:crossover junction endodeoxyribonuclease RuvC